MKEEFRFLNEEELKKKYQNTKKNFETRELIGEFLKEISKKGHKEVTKRIETYLKEFLDKRNIEYKNIFLQNLDANYGRKYFDRALIINLSNTITTYTIEIKNGYEDNYRGGFYDNLYSNNVVYRKDYIEKQKTQREIEFENAFLSINKYNQKLKELIKLRDSFGYLAK